MSREYRAEVDRMTEVFRMLMLKALDGAGKIRVVNDFVSRLDKYGMEK